MVIVGATSYKLLQKAVVAEDDRVTPAQDDVA
jgi:hypothetical protein